MRRGAVILSVLMALSPSFLSWAEQPPSAEPLPMTGELAPLDAEARAIFWAAPEDVEPDDRAKDAHFYVGNEPNLHIFYDAVHELGGAYVGVGSDQAYLFMGWQRPQVAWLIDYDRVVVDVHLVHHALLLAAETPEDYYALWKKRARKSTRALLADHYAEHARQAEILDVFDEARPFIYGRYRKLREHFEERPEVPTFLTDQATYDFIQALVRAGRVRPMLVNLLDDQGMVGIGQAARDLGVPIRVFYTSNAEQYWDYGEQFRNNIEALHVDGRSVVVRTIGRKHKTFNYNVQSFSNFKKWLAAGVEDIYHIKRTRVEREEGVFTTINEREP